MSLTKFLPVSFSPALANSSVQQKREALIGLRSYLSKNTYIDTSYPLDFVFPDLLCRDEILQDNKRIHVLRAVLSSAERDVVESLGFATNL